MWFLTQGRVLPEHRVGGSEMLTVGDQRSFRMTGGARRIDDKGGIIGRQRDNLRFEPGKIGLARGVEAIRRSDVAWHVRSRT